jgi:hypothetical protein
MILVELTTDMRPACAGESRLLPDDAARRLIAEGLAKNPRDRNGDPLPDPAGLSDFVRKPAYKTKRG